MKISKKNAWRAMGLLAALILLQASTGVSLVDASRDQANCVQACNNVRTLCKDQCTVDCAALFPVGQERNSCEGGCDQVCISESQECKAKCNVRKNPPSPTEP